MATYFGYVEREADSYVNWADVGRNMSATIDNIQRVRDEKKALIEKAYNEDLDYIQSRPAGEHETLNAWSLNFGNTSAENLKLKYSQLKQGKISVNDFVRFRQNLTDSVEKIYTVNNQLQEAFKKVNDRTKAGDNQEIERATKVLLEKYGALENTLPYVNGLTGTVAIGLTDVIEEDGKQVRKLRQSDDAYLTPEQLQAASMQEFNNFDPEPVLDNWAKKLGTVKESLRSYGGEDFSGMITSVEDIKGDRWRQIAKQNNLSEDQIKDIEKFISDFKASEDDFLNGILENKIDASAILTERLGINPKTGNPYTVVFNEKDQVSSDQLYVEKTKEGQFTPNFDTKFGKEQKADLQEYLRGQLNVKYNRIVEQQTYAEQRKERPAVRQLTSGDYEIMGKKERAKEYGSLLGKLYGLPYEDKEGTLTTIRNLTNGGSANFGKDNNGDTYILMENKDGDMRERIYYTKNGEPVPINTFVEQAATFLSGFEDIRGNLSDLRKAAIEESGGGVLNKDFGNQQNRTRSAWTDRSTLTQQIIDLKKEIKNTSNTFKLIELNKELNEKQILLDEIQYRGEGNQSQGQGGGTNLNASNRKGK